MSPNRCSIKPAILIAAVVAATGGYWALLASGIRLHALIPGYFWHFMYISSKPLTALWMIIPLIIISAAVVFFVMRTSSGYSRYLPLLMLLGYCTQMGFGLSEGRGIDGIRDRMVKTGHTEFAAVAAANDDIGRVATEYESILQMADSETFRYMRTKPPGQVIVYMLTQKVSNLISPVSDPDDKLDRLATFAAYLFPLMTYLVLIPLFLFARSAIGDGPALRACILYTFIPSITLVTLHLDQVLYPVLAMTCLMFAAFACVRKWLVYALLAGITVYLSLFISFSLLPVIPLVFLIVPVFCIRGDDRVPGLKLSAKIMAGIALGMLVMFAAGIWLLDYNPFVRFGNAMDYHEQWKAWTADTGATIQFAVLNVIEFACWTGIALMVIYGTHLFSSVAGAIKRRPTRIDILSLLFAGAIVFTAVLGRTRGEVGRLWIFFVPLICLFASHELSRRFEYHSNKAFGLILVLQFITILVMKKYMDFW